VLDRRYPIIFIRINGAPLSKILARGRVSNLERMGAGSGVITFTHTEVGEGGKELKFTVPDADYTLLDDPVLQGGADVLWSFGYEGAMSDTFAAKIYTTEPNFDAYGGLTLTVYCYDAVVEYQRSVSNRTWRTTNLATPSDPAKLTESEIVQQIALNNRMNADVEPTKTRYESVAQAGNDLDFIQRVLVPTAVAADPSKAGRYRVWFDSRSNTLFFRPPILNAAAVSTYTFMTENEDPVLLSFRPTVDTQRPDGVGATNTTVADVDQNGEVTVETATNETADRVATTDSRFVVDNGLPVQGAMRETAVEVQENPSGDATDAQRRAAANLAKKELEAVEAVITVVGDPFVRANDIVAVRNVGRKFSGMYLVNEVRHIFGEGYITEISGKRPALPADAAGTQDAHGGNSDPAAPAPDGTHKARELVGDIETEPTGDE
jgi:hypothetical protein